MKTDLEFFRQELFDFLTRAYIEVDSPRLEAGIELCFYGRLPVNRVIELLIRSWQFVDNKITGEEEEYFRVIAGFVAKYKENFNPNFPDYGLLDYFIIAKKYDFQFMIKDQIKIAIDVKNKELLIDGKPTRDEIEIGRAFKGFAEYLYNLDATK